MTLVEIQTTICNGVEKDPVANLRKYLNRLVDAGVMRIEVVDDGKLTSNGSYRYTVIRNLGPKAPIVRNAGTVFDPNSGALL
ncbi:MAG: hypothetical protein Q8J96_04475 [Rhodocyclaceae bacterium]|nr:hypothetical protein [Rhodocyclaceae bacterium]